MSKIMVLLLLAVAVPAFGQWQEKPDWAGFFAAAGVTGTIAVLDLRDGEKAMAHNRERAEQRFIPASTFKMPHALFALDAGAVRDEFETIEWDSEQRALGACNRDQDLRASMRNSVVRVYQRFAREIGEARGFHRAEFCGVVEMIDRELASLPAPIRAGSVNVVEHDAGGETAMERNLPGEYLPLSLNTPDHGQ